MSRSNYDDSSCFDTWSLIRWRGAVNAAIKGKRGQAALRELLEALDALPAKRLISDDLEKGGEVCALGALGRKRGVAMADVDPEDSDKVADLFGIAPALAREIVFMNDEWAYSEETPERRYERMRGWVASLVAGAGP